MTKRRIRVQRTAYKTEVERFAEKRAQEIAQSSVLTLTDQITNLNNQLKETADNLSLAIYERDQFMHREVEARRELSNLRKRARNQLSENGDAINRLIELCVASYTDGCMNAEDLQDSDGDTDDVLLDLAASKYRRFLSTSKDFRSKLARLAESLKQSDELETF